MHQSAMYHAQQFFEIYCDFEESAQLKIAEIGSQNVNGSIRDVAPQSAYYTGFDFVEGPGVDIIIDDPYTLPAQDSSFDIVVTSSCFEHSEFFWLSFLEIVRILKPGGYIYLNCPSNGDYHRYPVDCWRFYPDSGIALQNWALRSGYKIEMLESFIGEKSQENIWNDFVAVFHKKSQFVSVPKKLMIDNLTGYTHAWRGNNPVSRTLTSSGVDNDA